MAHRIDTDVELEGCAEVARDAVLARLHRARPRIVALTAPAGYGKSTLTRQYVASFRRHAICDLSTIGGASEYARAVVAALADESPDRSESLASLELRLCDVEPAAAAQAILPAWQARVDGSLVAFENADRLADLGLEEVLARMLAALPRGRTVVISSRKPLRLRLSRFASPHEIVTIRAADLAFGPHEIAALVGAEPHAKAIAAISEGWPVAVLLMARLAREPDFNRIITQLDDVVFSDLYEYLTVEVLAALDPSLVKTMVTLASIPDPTDGDLAALGVPAPAEVSPFLRRSCDGRFVLLPLLRTALLAAHPQRKTEILTSLAHAHLQGASYLRCAQIAVAAGDHSLAARALDAIDALERLPALEFAQVLAKIDPAVVNRFPKLWFFLAERRKYTIAPSNALAETRLVWRTLPPGVDPATRAAIFDKLVNRMLRLGLIEAALELIDERNEQLGAPDVPQTLEEADVVLMRSVIAARFGRFAEWARLIGTIERGIGFTEIMLLRTSLERAVHVERVRHDYAAECALLDALTVRSEQAGLSQWSAQALGHAIFGAWFAGDDVRATSLAETFDGLVRKHNFAGLEYFADCALGRVKTRPRGIEAAVWLAQAHLMAWHTSADETVARAHATAAREAADAWGNPFLRILARVALAQCEASAQLYAEAVELAAPIESPFTTRSERSQAATPQTVCSRHSLPQRRREAGARCPATSPSRCSL